MSFPRPEIGQVISYAYLWRSEFHAGRDEGTKDRPCAIVLVVAARDGRDEVVVLPITHTPPRDPADAVEIPAMTKRRLGLDDDRSWIVLTEANRFLWPGPDMRPRRPADGASIVYGKLPPRLFAIVRGKFIAGVRTHVATLVPRSE